MRCRSPSGYLQWNAAPDGPDGKHIPPLFAPLSSSFSLLSFFFIIPHQRLVHTRTETKTHTHTHTPPHPPEIHTHTPPNLPFVHPCGMFAFLNSMRHDVFGEGMPRKLLCIHSFAKIKEYSAVYLRVPYYTFFF